jgi:hypothetical protein
MTRHDLTGPRRYRWTLRYLRAAAVQRLAVGIGGRRPRRRQGA